MKAHLTPSESNVVSKVYIKQPLVAGFTLIELLVSSAILGIVMFIMLTTLTSTLSLWRTTESNIAADREGRSANFLLAQDLANIVMSSNKNLWPKITDNDSTLQFLTRRSADYQGSNEVGDLIFVEYRIQDDTNSSNTNFRSLTRNFVASAETYKSIKAGQFPQVNKNDAQLLAANIIPNSRIFSGSTEARDNNFELLLVTNTTDSIWQKGNTNPPNMISVTLSTADDEGVRTLDLTNKMLRAGGFFSFRQALKIP